MKKVSWIVVVLVVSIFSLVLAGCGSTTTTTAPATSATTADDESTTTTSGTETTGAVENTGEKVELTFAYFAPEATFPGQATLWWIDQLKTATDGNVTIKFFPGGTLLTAKNMYDGVLSGVADIGLSCPTYEPGRFPLISINDLPGLYTTGKQASLSIHDVVMANKDMAELNDFHVVAVFSMEPGYIMTIDKFDTLASLKGAEVRTPGGPKILEALGATGVAMPQSEVAQALQTGVVDGVYSSREVLQDFKYAEKCKHILNKPLGQVTFLAVMSKSKWDSLPAYVQAAIDNLSKPYAQKAGEIIDETANSSVEWAISSEGVTVVDLSADEDKKFDEALAPLTASWLADMTAKGVDADAFYKSLQEAAATNK